MTAAERRRGSTWLWVATAFLCVAGSALVAGWVLQRYEDSQGFEREADRIAAILEVRPGSTVGDVGAGSGRWSIDLARRVGPTGHVFATEVTAEQVAKLDAAIGKAGLSNVTAIQQSQEDTGLADGCCDAILIRATYHDFTARSALNASVRRALRPEGRLLMIDFHQGTPEQLSGHGIAIQTLIDEVTAAGFDVVRVEDDWSRTAYAVLFRHTTRETTQP